MKFLRLNTTLFTFIILFTPFTNISASTFYADNGDFTTIDGLDWLDLTQSTNMTVDQALSTHTEYRIATEDEYTSMIQNFYTLNPAMFDNEIADSVTTRASDLLFEKTNSGFSDNLFFDLFGITSNELSSINHNLLSYGWYDIGSSTGFALGGISIVDRLIDNTNQIDKAYVFTDGQVLDSTFHAPHIGSFLVKSISLVPTPLPGALVFMVTGLLGLVGLSHRKARS